MRMKPGSFRSNLTLHLLWVLVCVAPSASFAATANEPQLRVIVLANSDDEESMRLARYYVEKRGVPEANIMAYPMSQLETISWGEFVSTIWEPLMSDLVRASWINAIKMETRDAVGRRKYATQGHHISYLVVCRGVPLRIAQDVLLKDQPLALPAALDARMQSNQAAVDSELTVMAMAHHPAMAYISNPLFHNEAPNFLDESQVVKVSRLDGPTYESARALIDHALEAEISGLMGRAYVDQGGPYTDGDLWLLETEKLIAATGIDFYVDRSQNTLPAWGRFDAPILYFGWYTTDCTGPMAQPEFRFPPGAVAYHLHSFSAHTLRDTSKGWCGPLVARGVTATFGYVYEPYLALTQRPQLFLRALLKGWSFGDAGFHSIPALSWQNILIGDPLYRPFAKSFDSQWAQRGEMGSRRAGYLVLRKMRLLESEGKAEVAMEMGQLEQNERPSLALALGLASRLVVHSKGAEAARMLEFVRYHPPGAAEDSPLMLEAARIIAEFGNKDVAFDIFDKILTVKGMKTEYRVLLIQEGLRWTKGTRDIQRQVRWQRELAALHN